MSFATINHESAEHSLVNLFDLVLPRELARIEREEQAMREMKQAIADTQELYQQTPPRPVFVRREWTQDEVNLCVAMRDDGNPWACVSETLGISVPACKARYWRVKKEGK